MTTSDKSVKHSQPIALDPNFFLPPNVVDMRYVDPDVESDSATTRADNGEVVNVDYDEVDFSELSSQPDDDGAGQGSAPFLIQPPDSLSVISQQVRVTSDGRFVVDVILEVEDIAGVVQYDVRVAKP